MLYHDLGHRVGGVGEAVLVVLVRRVGAVDETVAGQRERDELAAVALEINYKDRVRPVA